MPHHHVHPLISPSIPSALHATWPPAITVKPSVLDPPRRTLFAQRLAVLIQRFRAAAAAAPLEEHPNDCH
jgi:hypothetical protein